MACAGEKVEPSFQIIESVQTSLLNYMKPKQTVSLSTEPSRDTTSAKKRAPTEDENASCLGEPVPKKPNEGGSSAPAMQQMNVNPFDIGMFYEKVKMPDAEKYSAFNNIWKPDLTFVFPVSTEAGKNRSFLHSWQQQFPWLAYSESLNGAFCKMCVFLGMQTAARMLGS